MENQVFVIIPPRSDSLFGQGCAQGYTDVKLWNARSQELYRCRTAVVAGVNLQVLVDCKASRLMLYCQEPFDMLGPS